METVAFGFLREKSPSAMGPQSKIKLYILVAIHHVDSEPYEVYVIHPRVNLQDLMGKIERQLFDREVEL